VLRGGSFNNNQRNARAASRNRNNPDNRNNNVGVRVVVAHDTLTRPEIRRVYGFADEAKQESRRTMLLAAPP